jgi:hypothetical protein
MRDRLQIIEGYEALLAAGQPAAVATVVSVEGSSYRLPGARMLVAEDGRQLTGDAASFYLPRPCSRPPDLKALIETHS